MPYNSEDERLVQAASRDVHMANAEQRRQPPPAQGATRMQLEVPLHAHPTMATPRPTSSSSPMVPEIDDIDPIGDDAAMD
eukprot:13899180-Alexandrium_andersonii.AAC.1